MNYIINLMPSPCCLIGGDFNAMHDIFDPGADNWHCEDELIWWASSSGISFISEAGNPIQAAGNILNLTFLNIPFAYTFLWQDIHNGSDYKIIITTVPLSLDQADSATWYKIVDKDIPIFTELVYNGLALLGQPDFLADAASVNTYTHTLSAILISVMEVASHPPKEGDYNTL